jgi:hypothetical protein
MDARQSHRLPRSSDERLKPLEEWRSGQAPAIEMSYLSEDDGNAFTQHSLAAASVMIGMRPQRWLSNDYATE